MSLLRTIKGTFKGVQTDISEGLKSLTTSPVKPTVPEVHHLQLSVVNYDAGGDLLNKHELIWKELYQSTEETANKAQDVDVDIGGMFVYYDRQSEVLMKLNEEAANLPVLLTHLQEITDTLAHVEEECDKVEAALVHLENICEEQEFNKNIASHHKQLSVYKMKKEHEIQKFKVKMAREHAQKMEQVNKKRKHLMDEKRSAFEDQFTQDVDYFKKHGKPGRSPSSSESEKKLDLADIEIEEDQSALDAFLDSSTSDVVVTDTKDNSETGVLSDGDGPSVDILDEITSPSEEGDVNITSPSEDVKVTSPSEEGDVNITSPSEDVKVTSPSEEECQNTIPVEVKEKNKVPSSSEEQLIEGNNLDDQTDAQSVPQTIPCDEGALNTDSNLPSDQDREDVKPEIKSDE